MTSSPSGPVAALLEEWALRPDGPAPRGGEAVVLPVRDADGVPLALKVRTGGRSTGHEHVALRAWDGRGAVGLVRADPARGALLLERAGPRDLTGLPPVDACELLAGLYADLHVPAPGRLPRLSAVAEGWAAELGELSRDAPVPRRLVQHARSLARGFATDPATDGTLVHGDLHGAHVLAAHRLPWLAVAPRGLNGDPHAEPAPVLWSRWDEVVASGDVRWAVRQRFHTLVDVAGLDEDRARDWVVVRAVHHALGGDHDRVTRCIAVAKAVQD